MKRIIPLLFTGWVFACINVPEIEPRPVPTPPEESDSPDSGTPLGDLTISITDPVEKAYTSTSITLTVEVRGGVADTVQLHKEGELLATLSSPFRYTWDTTREEERDYALTARAIRSGKVFTSAPVTVVVDRTNLQVASRSPANDATNVDYSQPIQVVFTKPVKETTVSDTTVSFAVAGVLTDKTLTLSSDGKTLTIKPKERPALPAKFSIGLSRGITDIAGNALVVPSTSWAFEVPDWYSFGGAIQATGGDNSWLKDPSMVIDAQDNPIVAWTEAMTYGGRASIFVYKWDGKAFAPIGPALNGTATGSAYHPSIALANDGNPVVAWHESDGFNENIYVKRWTGANWQTVGTGPLSAENDIRPSPLPTPARNPSIATNDRNIYVAWEEQTIEGHSTIYVWKSFNGENFSSVGPSNGSVNAVPGRTSGTNPSLVLNRDGQPIVAFQEETKEQDPSQKIYVLNYKNGTWHYAVPPFQDSSTPNNSGGLSSSTDFPAAKNCSLTIDLQNNLHLAWEETSQHDAPSDIHVFRSSGAQTWTRTGHPLSSFSGLATFARFPSIHATESGRIFTTWREFSWYKDGFEHLLSSSWDGSNWTSLTATDGLNKTQDTVLISRIKTNSHEQPIVIWLEDNSSRDPYSGRRLYVRKHNE
ncbi:Ig-like domain-containing protein [Melittangium boletus]|nr:Ig-like domain-containing protein [Melittangium boletus]